MLQAKYWKINTDNEADQMMMLDTENVIYLPLDENSCKLLSKKSIICFHTFEKG